MRMASVTSSPLSRMRPGRELDLRGQGQLLHAVHVVGVDVLPQRPQGHGAVHGAGVDIGEAQALGQASRDGALAGAGRPVDGDHDAFCVWQSAKKVE